MMKYRVWLKAYWRRQKSNQGYLIVDGPVARTAYKAWKKAKAK